MVKSNQELTLSLCWLSVFQKLHSNTEINLYSPGHPFKKNNTVAFWSTQFYHCIIAKNLSRIYKTLAFKTIVLKTTYRKTGPRSRTVQFVCIHIQSIQILQHGNTLHTYRDIFWIKEVNFIIRQSKTKISVRNIYFIIIITQNKISNVHMIRGIQIKNINTLLKNEYNNLHAVPWEVRYTRL